MTTPTGDAGVTRTEAIRLLEPINAAEMFARRAHAGQTDKCGWAGCKIHPRSRPCRSCFGKAVVALSVKDLKERLKAVVQSGGLHAE